MNPTEWFRNRKRDNEDKLAFAEKTPGFRFFQVTTQGGEVDITQQHKDSLRDAIATYQRAIDLLEGKPTQLPPGRPFVIK